MIYFHYNSKTGDGWAMSEEEAAEAGLGAFLGVGAFTAIYLIMSLIIVVLLSPFFMLYFLDNFIETTVANNVAFFILLGVVLLLLKLIPTVSEHRFVRVLFDLCIAVSVLYIVLYLLKFDIPVYTYFHLAQRNSQGDNSVFLELWGTHNIVSATESWFYSIADGCVEAFRVFSIWSLRNIASIDRSCFEASVGEINIIEVIVTVCKYILYGGTTMIIVAIWGIFMLEISVLTIIVPYILAAVCIILVNKLVYRIRYIDILKIKKDSRYEEAMRICIKELRSVLDNERYINLGEAVAIYEKAANAGNPGAQVVYANYLSNGYGVKNDAEKSFYWYKKSAYLGATQGQIMTAISYFHGIGVKKNNIMARVWLDVAMKDETYIKEYIGDKNALDALALIDHKTRFLKYL